MRLLLDSHVVLWWLANTKLRAEADAAIRDPRNAVFVSAATAWEIAIKQALGKLESPGDLQAQLAAADLTPLPITIRHGLAAGALPRHHNDPFDRMLIAQARLDSMTIVTRDRRFSAYDVSLLPV